MKTITREEVIERSQALPIFPIILNKILATIDDFDANFNVLVNYVKHDPVIAARVLSVASLASRNRQNSQPNDIHSAISMIGMGRVREIAILSSMAGFVKSFTLKQIPVSYWTHSVAVGVCAEELAQYDDTPQLSNAAMIAGLLHDIGQLWLYCFYGDDIIPCYNHAISHCVGIEVVERERFGIDHQLIGGWLAENWALPESICTAIRHHHAPDAALDVALVPLLHVAEALSNALDLTGRAENLVSAISTPAFKKLGLIWGDDSRPEFGPLFGRIEARSRHVNELMQHALTRN